MKRIDKAKIRHVIELYRREFERRGTPKKEFPHHLHPASNLDRMSHLHAMLDKMEEFLEEDRIEKTFRWLGFIQGAMWMPDGYTLEELKNHNRPD